MGVILLTAAFAVFLLLTYIAWRRYLWAAEPRAEADACPYSLTDVFGDNYLAKVPHQKGVRWLTDVFSRSARTFPHVNALHIPHTGESLTFAELDEQAERIASLLSPYVTGPDQVVAVAMPQDNWQIVASHLGILKAGGTQMLLDTSLPDALITHMLQDAQPVVVLTRGQKRFRDLPTLDVLNLPETTSRREHPSWLDDPAERLATIFYTSGTTGMPKGVECPHAGYVNLALSYADYFDLVPGMDATSLTSSLGYDGSISEMYSAWVSGCSVVMLTKEQVRSGPDLVPLLREAEVTVLFCPPALLPTITPSPEIDLPYPLCRYIVPAGEAFPTALVEPWTRARRQIINTYGPTEASTDTSRQSLRPGEPITIGSPFPNVTYVILEIDDLKPLPHGEVGELCIGGVHVARGYRKLPEQTAERFITHPQFGRLYRTGDKCRIDIHTQRVHFLGRIDAQLKVRGHRVEAQAVEDILQTQFSEIEAAVLDYQNEELVAFVAAPSIRTSLAAATSPAPAEWASRVTNELSKQLPAIAVPARIFIVDKFDLKPISGKIDRTSLPNLADLAIFGERVPNGIGTAEEAAVTAPEDTDGRMERDRNEVLAICRSVFETPLGLDDGFAEAGGHSIAIARLAQKLRAAGWVVPVRSLLSDCNTARLVAERPRAADQHPPAVPSRSSNITVARDEKAAEILPVWQFTLLQVLFSVLLYSPVAVTILLFLEFVDIEGFFGQAGVLEFVAAGLVLYLLTHLMPFAALLWVMTIKSFINGDNYKNNVVPGVYPKWSRMHLRIWFIGKLQDTVLLPLAALFRSAPLMVFALRQLGASVGKNVQCAHDASLSGPLDLITIEDDVAIQTGAYIHTTTWSGQFLKVGPIRLESECKIGMRAAIAGNVTVGSGTWITPFTSIFEDVGAHELWEGSPARLSGRHTELKRANDACRYKLPIWALETLNILMQISVISCVSVIPTAVIVWATRELIFGGAMELSDAYFRVTALGEIILSLALYTYVTAWLTIIVTSVLGCIFIRLTPATPGLYPSRAFRAMLLMLRMNMMNRIQRRWNWSVTGQYLRALAGVRFARVGASECDLMMNLVPEQASADSQVFWSNGSLTNMLDLGSKYLTLRRLDMPANFFSGNNCVAEHGQFPANFLLGVSTPASDIQFRRQMRSRMGASITVAGNPPVKFAGPSFEAENLAQCPPSFSIFLSRILLNDVFSIGFQRVTGVLAFSLIYIGLLRLGDRPIVNALIAFVFTEIILVLMAVTIKKLLVGGTWGSSHSTPFWSWRHFAYFFAQDCFFVWCRGPLGFSAGSVLSNSLLRRMGCRIGQRTIITQPMQCFDWNAVSFGNDCVIDGYLQYHTFENMTLKVKRTEIKDGCAVNFGATVMGGALIEQDSTLMPVSLVLKEMEMPTGTYAGSPAEPAARDEGLSVIVHDVDSPTIAPVVDNTDWLKAAAIIFVLVDHFGYFFMENDLWWAAFGRFAAPVFFFLVGYAKTRTIPLHWVGLGVFLTVLDSWNADWTWVAPNILLSFVLIRIARPRVEQFVERYPWSTYVVMFGAFLAVLPFAGQIADYGVEGWLWALFGLYHRQYADSKEQAPIDSQTTSTPATVTTRAGTPLRLLACFIAAGIYIWQEQKEFAFPETQLAVVILGIAIVSVSMCLFLRGASRLQPPDAISGPLRFVGRHTLEIYAIQLAVSEVIIKLVPWLGA